MDTQYFIAASLFALTFELGLKKYLIFPGELEWWNVRIERLFLWIFK